MNRPEVLAPAGDWERMEAAVRYGADAIYLGGTMFGMRASAAKFDEELLPKAVEYCHQRGVKVYLTCNVLAQNAEIPELERSLLFWRDSGVDALIISDIGIFALAHRLLPDMELHVSTQAGIVNYLTATEFYHMGAKRVVLAREMSLEDIKLLRENTPPELEIECFVHGAMCMSFSGRCLISQYMTGRDANHGECAQSCRWNYRLVEEKRPTEYYPVVEEEEGTYFFNAKDLCVLQQLDQLAQAGINSFKIEGRAKSAYYVSVVANAYKTAVDILMKDPDHYQLPNWLSEEVYKVSHREYSTGFYFDKQQATQCYQSAGYVREWDVVAIVDFVKDGMLYCTQRNRFRVGQTLELLKPGEEPQSFEVSEILDDEENNVEIARHPMRQFHIPWQGEAQEGMILRAQSLS